MIAAARRGDLSVAEYLWAAHEAYLRQERHPVGENGPTGTALAALPQDARRDDRQADIAALEQLATAVERLARLAREITDGNPRTRLMIHARRAIERLLRELEGA